METAMYEKQYKETPGAFDPTTRELKPCSSRIVYVGEVKVTLVRIIKGHGTTDDPIRAMDEYWINNRLIASFDMGNEIEKISRGE
jgi:hypothetical protein